MSESGSPFTILYIDNSGTFGGAINSLAHLVAALDRSAVEPLVVSAQPPTFLARAFPGVRTEHLPTSIQWQKGDAFTWLRRSFAPRSRILGRAVDHARAGYWLLRHHLPEAFRLAALARDVGADLIHLNNNAASQIAGILASRLAGIPCVAHARGSQTPRWFLRRMARLPAAHVAISREMRENVRSLGVAPERIALIPDGIDLTAYEVGPPDPRLRRDLGIPAEAPSFALVGRIVPWKGILEFIAAAERVLEAMPDAVALVVGDVSDGDEAYATAVRDRIEAARVGDRILLTGFRDDVAALMRSVDCVVHASTEPEPFGLVVVEAMAVGTPVVAADAGGPRDIVVPGETGFLVDPRDPEAMASAILKVIRDPELGRRLGEAGARRVRERFSKERYARDVEELYRSILDGTGSPRTSE